MSKLYEIKEDYSSLVELMMQAMSENDTEQVELYRDALQINEEEFKEKALNYSKVIRSEEASIEAIEAEIKRLQGMKKTKESSISYLKSSLSNAMQLFEFDKYDLGIFKLSFRKSESIEITDIDLIPDHLKREKISIEADKALIKAGMKEGLIILGAYIKENYSLQIR